MDKEEPVKTESGEERATLEEKAGGDEERETTEQMATLGGIPASM